MGEAIDQLPASRRGFQIAAMKRWLRARIDPIDCVRTIDVCAGGLS